MYTQVGVLFGSVRNSLKFTNLTVLKVGQFFQSTLSFTKFTLATRKIKRMKAFARFSNEFWFMDLEYVDKLVKVNNGVKYLLFRQDLFDRTVDAERVKTKDAKETVCAFLINFTKNTPSKTF